MMIGSMYVRDIPNRIFTESFLRGPCIHLAVKLREAFAMFLWSIGWGRCTSAAKSTTRYFGKLCTTMEVRADNPFEQVKDTWEADCDEGDG